LFVGTANLFGPEVAVKRKAGWFYVPNEAGGGEVWLGTATPARAEDEPSAPPGATDESRDAVTAYYGGSDFRHLGLWRPGIRTLRAACENLVEELLAFTRPVTRWRVPLPTSDAEDIAFFRRRVEHREQDEPERPAAAQSILDLGCGLGATTRHLLKYYPAAQVTAVASDSRELAACARNAPGVRVLAMPLPRLLLGEQRFDHVMCVEGPSRLGSPATLFRQVFRVLKPGGWLVCSDLLMQREPKRRWRWKRETALDDPETYRALLRKTGFSEVQVVDVTDETWGCSYRHALKFGLEHIASHGLDEEFMREFREQLLRSGGADYYVIACARRPCEHVVATEGDVSPAA
jgi:SAM-dependent methyltransferase